MTKVKLTFTEILEAEGFAVKYAPEGFSFKKYPNGNTINLKGAKVIISTTKRHYAGTSIQAALMQGFRNGEFDIFKYGYNTCHRCTGTGNLDHYSGVHSGVCFKCNGLGVI